MQDPTREEMLDVLDAMAFADDFSNFDREEAIYWFANNWHSGQTSNLYSALSTSPFWPGPFAKEPEEMATMLYEELEAAFR